MKKLWMLTVFAMTLYGADISGKWTGNIEVTDPTSGEKIVTAVKAEFQQSSNGISGKIGRVEDAEAETIRNVKLEGNSLRFDVQPPEATSPMKFVLTVTGQDRIEGEMHGAVDVGNIAGKVILRKAK